MWQTNKVELHFLPSLGSKKTHTLSFFSLQGSSDDDCTALRLHRVLLAQSLNASHFKAPWQFSAAVQHSDLILIAGAKIFFLASRP